MPQGIETEIKEWMKNNENVLKDQQGKQEYGNDDVTLLYECQRGPVLQKSAPMGRSIPDRKIGRLSSVRQWKMRWLSLYWIQQHFPVFCCPYGSSARPTGPQTEGTRWSFVVLQYRIRLALASLTLIRGRARSSLRRWLCSIKRLNFNSDIDCRPPVRELIMALKSW